MLTKIQMYRRTASGKGFLQHFRLPFDSPLQIKGVCSGASKVWLSDHFYSGGDREFWKKYNNPFSSHGDMTNAQKDTQKYSMGVTLRHVANVVAKDDPSLWEPADPHNLKYYTLAFRKVAAHAMAAYTPVQETAGQLFDPNLGQFDIGAGHYQSWSQLWADLWEYYDLYSVDVYSAELKEVLTFEMED